MSAEEVELARRFVACKGWVWLPGMLAPGRGRVCSVDGETLYFAGTDGRFNGDWEDHQCLPDLSDALTRAGLLPVVRQALGVPNLTPIIGADGWYLHGIPDDRPELWWSSGQPSELHALLAALEAAPGV